MKIKVKKSGRFTYRKPRRGMIKVKEGSDINIESEIAQAMIDCGWAEEASKSTSKKIEPSVQVPEKPVKKSVKKQVKKKSKKDK